MRAIHAPKTREERRYRRHLRVRKKVSGSASRPRLVVFRSLKHLYAQLVDDDREFPKDFGKIRFGTREKAEEFWSRVGALGVKADVCVGVGIKPVSWSGTARLVHSAIAYAVKNKRQSVTLVHKGNIMKFTEGAFRGWGYEAAREQFGGSTISETEVFEKHGGKTPAGKILVNDRIADSIFQQVLLRPKEYHVLATPNLNGDYLSDACAAQVGGLGMAPGANMSDEIAFFEATHGTAPKYAGQDKVNPGSLILSGVMMLEHLGWQDAADTASHSNRSRSDRRVPTPYWLDIGRRPKLVRIVDTQEATDDNYDLTVFGSAGAEASRADSMLARPLYALLRPELCAERHIARTRSGVQDFRSIGGWSPSELAREMAQHVVAINYGGMRALEAACVGTPSIIIPRNEGERLNAHGLMAAGAALIADESEAETMAQSLIEMPALAERMSHKAKALVDGHGVQRVVRAIERLFA